MSEQGKCEECGKPTKMRDDGTAWRKCFECNQKAREAKTAKQEAMPVRSVQEQMQDISATFKIAMDFMAANYPGMPPELAVRVALDLNNQYWKNDRTPR